MAQRRKITQFDVLWDENQRLRRQVALLEESLRDEQQARYELEDELDRLLGESSTHEAQTAWPYSWFAAAHSFFVERFHSFHEKLFWWHLKRRNKSQRVKFWQTPHLEEIKMELV
jgi:hypothetical protein